MSKLYDDIEALRDSYVEKAIFAEEIVDDLKKESPDDSVSSSAINRMKITSSLFRKFSRELTKLLEDI